MSYLLQLPLIVAQMNLSGQLTSFLVIDLARLTPVSFRPPQRRNRSSKCYKWEGKEHTSYSGKLNRHATRRNGSSVFWERFADYSHGLSSFYLLETGLLPLGNLIAHILQAGLLIWPKSVSFFSPSLSYPSSFLLFNYGNFQMYKKEEKIIQWTLILLWSGFNNY